jgi:hypothetical protein
MPPIRGNRRIMTLFVRLSRAKGFFDLTQTPGFSIGVPEKPRDFLG